jgi:hypothetical protein
MSNRLTQRFRFVFAGAVLMATLATLAAGPEPAAAVPAAEDEPAAVESRTFIGTPDGAPRSARIGVVTNGTAFVAYVCSQEDAFNKACSQWIKGTVAGKSKLQGEVAGVKLDAELNGDKIDGTLTADGKTLKFSAAAVEPGGCTGLYRAEDAVDGENFVLGWIVDADGSTVGNTRNTSSGINQAQKGGNVLIGAIQGQATTSATPVRGSPVLDPNAALPKGKKGSKFDDKKRQEIRTAAIARLKARGGSALHLAVVGQIKRFLAGEKPVGPIEEKTFARLAKTKRGTLQSYIKLWDGLPAATRAGLVPNDREFASLDRAPLSKEIAGRILARENIAGLAKFVPATRPIKKVTATTLHCVDESEPETFLGFQLFDEVFVVYVVSNGTLNYSKKTATYTGFKDGVKKTFTPADGLIFPPSPQSNLTSSAPLLVLAMAFEDDSGLLDFVVEVVEAIADVAILVVGVVEGDADPASTIASINDAIASAAASIPTAQLLAGDTMIIKTDGTRTDLNGQPKNQFLFKRTQNNAGGPFEYRIEGINVTQ